MIKKVQSKSRKCNINGDEDETINRVKGTKRINDNDINIKRKIIAKTKEGKQIMGIKSKAEEKR